MYLKKLEMFGFKSFADRTELAYQPGMTAIVGPNGCGKSNVVDAFKWIFGEQSAKGLRGSEMKDVIFNGTAERKPTGFAEVTIVFDNADRFLDVDYSEVAITRRLYRSGESEYLLNKQKCRLKDIRGLFMGTGVGQTSYSILEQGKIDALLQANHVERRSIFEEAAGISKYLAKKAETLRALLRVEENLTRLNDIIDEVEKRLQRVKAQASKARRYRELSERLKELRVRAAIEDYRESVLARADVSFRLHWCHYRLGLLDRAVQVLSEGVETRAAARRVAAEALHGFRERVSEVRLAIERTRERIDHSRHRAAELREEHERKLAEVVSSTESLDAVRGRLEAQRGELVGLVGEKDRQRGELQARQTELNEVRAARESLEAGLAGRQAELVGIFQERARLSNGVVQIDAELSNLASRRTRVEWGVAGFQTQTQTETERRTQLEEQMTRWRAEAAEVESVRTEVDARQQSILDELGGLEKEIEAKVGRLHQRRSRHEVLKSLEENLEGLSLPVADVLRKKATTPALADVRGIVAELVRVESRYARAVEAALGVHAQALVTEGQDGALELLQFARGEDVGGLEVISLDRVDFIAPEHFPRQAGVLGPLAEKVDVPDELRELIDRLLANVVLVEDFETALALSRNGLRPFRLATLDGEMIEPWGGFSRVGERELGLISRRSEMEDLQCEVAALEQEDVELRAAQGELKARLAGVQSDLGRLRERAAEISRAVAGVDGDLAHVSRELDRLQREIVLGQAEIAEIASQIAKRGEEKAAIETEIAVVEARREAAEAGARALEQEIHAAAERETATAEALTGVRLALAQVEEREESLRRLVSHEEQGLKEGEARLEDLRGEIQALTERQAQLAETLASSEREQAALTVREDAHRAELDQAEAENRRAEEQEQQLHRELDTLHKAVSSIQEERGSAELRDQEERHRRSSILERMAEEYGLDVAALLDAEPAVAASTGGVNATESPAPRDSGSAPDSAAALNGTGELVPSVASTAASPPEAKFLEADPSWDREKAREEIRELQEKLRRLGSVNLEALTELDELEERYRFQLAQRTDLQDSEGKMRGIIAEINAKSRELFQKTFEEVQVHFSELFRKCFGGGSAELVLEEGMDILEAGIDIVAKPPGKKITSISLMSGGEKTMTTIALLFAIFRTRPSPFCILDEVDAPLDETNVRRFVVLLQDFLRHTQFVVITHNKVTMAEANTLYGITMQEHGVSKRVAVELESYDPQNLALGAATN